MEECILQNPSDMIGEARDQIEYHLQVLKNEVEDEEDGSCEELEEDLFEEVEQKQLEETPFNGNDHKSGFVKPIDKKRYLNVTSGELTTFLCHQSRKKCKQVESSGLKLESGSSDLELNNDSVTAVASIDNSSSKEGTGSSGKRRRSRWEPQSEDDGVKDDQTCKRRKTRWSNEDTQLKMLGPLQLPDFTKDVLVGYENNHEIQGLKAELFEINRRLLGPLHDDRLEEERSPSPEPIYDDLGIRINDREERLSQKLIQKRQNIISKLIKSNRSFNPPDCKPPKLFKKLYIPLKEYPEYNFVGLIIGPRGNTLKRMENETGAKIHIRGKGCSKTPNKSASSKEDLHVYIEADNTSSLDAAVAMVEKLLIPVEGRNEHKEAQLKELAMLNGTARDETMCYVCGHEGHLSYACPDLQSTFKLNSCNTCFRASFSIPFSACSLDVLSPQYDSVQGSGFGFSFSPTQSGKWRPENKPLMNNLYVGNLPQTFDDNRLSELFSPFGKIIEVKAIKDRTTGICRGFGFVKFDNATDAQIAMTHMNSFKVDGRVLKVGIARLLSNTESSSLNLLRQRSGPAGISQSVISQTDWSGPFHFMLPEHPTSFHNSSGMSLCSSTLKDQSFSPPSYFSSPSDNSGKMHFSCNFSDHSVLSSGSSFSQSPGSQYQSYFVTPPLHKASLPYHDHRLEDANSFPSSLQRRYYRALN